MIIILKDNGFTADDVISVKMLPNSNIYQEYTMYLHCKTTFLRSAVSLTITKEGQNYRLRDQVLAEDDRSQYAEKSLVIYINFNTANYYARYQVDEFVNYTCTANLNDLDVYPYAYSANIASYSIPVKQFSK